MVASINQFPPIKSLAVTLLLGSLLCACGGASSTSTPHVERDSGQSLLGPSISGSNSAPATSIGNSNVITWTSGVFPASTTYENRCAAPRAGTNPATGKPFPDKQGSESEEKFWLRSISQETYLWPDDLVDVNPNNYSLLPYFDQLKSPAKTAGGKNKDQFHFYEKSSDQYENFVLGKDISVGIRWKYVGADLTVLSVQPASPADKAGVRRGMILKQIDGTDLSAVSDSLFNTTLSPTAEGETHRLGLAAQGDTVVADFVLRAENLQESPVFPVQTVAGLSGEKVGYIGFHSFNGPSEAALIDAVNNLQTNQVTELVLDLRYNGGGYIGVASQLAYMLVGKIKTEGKIFSRTHLNAALEAQASPGQLDELFANTTLGYSKNLTPGQALPQLNLKRLYVLTGKGTCSASELLINSLRGIDVPVIQIGNTTCGKPYGFFGLENCGYMYYTVNLQTLNAKGFGDYADGMSPADTLVNQGSPAGCVVDDDLTQPLGSIAEKRLAAALQHISTGQCATMVAAQNAPVLGDDSGDAQLKRRLELMLPKAIMENNMVK